MKDFTTSDHIRPIINEITGKFYIDHPAPQFFNYTYYCILTAAQEPGPGRAAYIVTPEKDLYIPGLKSVKKLYRQIDAYTSTAETEPGELDDYNSREKRRIFQAVKMQLLKTYGAPATYQNGHPVII